MTFTVTFPLLVALAMPASEPGARVVVVETDRHTAYLGVGLRDVTEDNVGPLKLKEARGAVIVTVDHDGPAAKLFRQNDVILELNHEQVSSGEDVRRILRELPAGRKVDAQVSRDGNQVSVQVVTGDRAVLARREMPELEKLQEQLSRQMQQVQPVMAMGDNFADFGDLDVTLHGALAGAQVESVGPQLAHYFGAKDGTGVLVKEVRDNTAASHAGFKAGDFIVRVNGDAVNSRVDWDRKLRENAGRPVKVDVLRRGGDIKLTLTIPDSTQGELGVASVGDVAELHLPELTAQAEKALAEAQRQIDANSGEMQRQAVEKATEALNSAEVKAAMEKAQAEIDSGKWQKSLDEVNAKLDSKQIQKAMQDAQKQIEAMQPEIDKAMQNAADELDKLDMQ